jgi:hypothetical protein
MVISGDEGGNLGGAKSTSLPPNSLTKHMSLDKSNKSI